jgi:uncharacterized phiE125 gp8 family phage protein
MFNPTFASKNREVGRATLLQAPALEPITLSEAKKQCEIAESDTAHDDQLDLLIQAAREQWESDTDSCCLTQVWSVSIDTFPGVTFKLPKRPVKVIADITYYDAGNQLQLLGEEVYSLNAPARTVHLNTLQNWPSTYERWDAVNVTFAAGYATVAEVPAIHKQAIRLLVGYYFENRDMLMSDALQSVRAYESLVAKYLRSSYP